VLGDVYKLVEKCSLVDLKLIVRLHSDRFFPLLWDRVPAIVLAAFPGL